MPGHEHYRWDGDNLILYCHVQPGARREGTAGLHGGRLKVRLQAPPSEGKANKALIRLLASAFAVPRRRVELRGGAAHRHKTLLVHRPTRLPDDFQIRR